MRRRTSSRSKRRCSRTVAPASAAASRLSRPRMCDGGVATWKRSSGPSPEGRAPVGGGVAEGPVGVAHGLGQPGGARAEHEDHVVVLGGAGAGGPGSAGGRGRGGGRRVVEVGDGVAAQPVGEQRGRRAVGHGEAGRRVSPRAWSTSTAFQAGLNSTAAAPTLLTAWTAATNSTRLAVITATRSPGPAPRATRWRAMLLASPSRSPKDQRSSPALTASRSPKRSAASSRPRCIRVAIGNIVLRWRDRRQHGPRVGFAAMVTSPDAAGTDPEVRREIVETVRRFVAREVAPVAADLEREDRFPAAIVEQMRGWACSASPSPSPTAGSASTWLTYIGVIEELAAGWMSLTGIVNTHTMAATLLVHHGSDEQKRRWLPSMATGERRGALSLSEPDAGSDTRNIACQARATATSTCSTAPRRGSPTASAPPSSRSPPAPTRASRPSSSRRSPAPPSQASRSAGTWGSWATRASRRSRWPTPTTRSRPPTSSASRAGAWPRSSACWRSGASTSPPGPWASPAPPSTPPWPMPSSAPRSASPSASTRRSSSSWPTWPPRSRRRGC